MKRRRRPPISSINVVPYLDVMLVLLVIFMITAPLFNQGSVDLPSVDDVPPQQSGVQPLDISYRAQGGIDVTDNDSGETIERMNRDEALDELKKKRLLLGDGAGGQKPKIRLSVDGKADYGEVLKFLVAVQAIGFDVGLAYKTE